MNKIKLAFCIFESKQEYNSWGLVFISVCICENHIPVVLGHTHRETSEDDFVLAPREWEMAPEIGSETGCSL